MTSLIEVLSHVFVPLTIIISITSIIGILGNALAFYIFRFRFPSSGFNILMASLAVYDMLACTIHMPLDIATFFDIGESRSYICKITCFQLAFTATGVALILMSIAVVRFMGIYKPLLASFSATNAVYVIVISALIACGLALPVTFLFGDGELVTDSNETARICAVEPKFMSTNGPLIYYCIIASLYIVTFIGHTCLYIKSVVIIWKRRQTFVMMKVNGKNNVVMMSPARQRDLNRFQLLPTSSPSNSSPASVRSVNSNADDTSSLNSPPTRRPRQTNANSPTLPRVDESEMEILSETVNRGQTQSQNSGQNPNLKPRALPRINPNLVTNAAPPTPLPRSLHSTNGTGTASRGTLSGSGKNGNNNVNHQTSYRILAVVIAISMTYFLSYAPHFGVMFYLFTHDKAVFTSSAQSLVFELLMRSFFLNNILDPVIYGLLSKDFRQEAKKVICGDSQSKSCCLSIHLNTAVK